jgi:hypothetical protein
MQRENITSPFSIGGNKTAMFHRLNADNTTISPVVDPLVFPDMKSLVDKIHATGLKVRDDMTFVRTHRLEFSVPV